MATPMRSDLMLRNIGAASELYWDSMRLEEQTDEYGVRVAERLRAQVREVESLNALRALQTRADEHAAGLVWMMGQQGGVGMTLPPDMISDSMFDPTFDPMCHTMASFNPSLTAGLGGTLRDQLWLPPVSTDECSGDIWPSTSETRMVPFDERKAAKAGKVAKAGKAAKAAQKRKAADSKPARPPKPTKAGKTTRNPVCRLSFGGVLLSDVLLAESGDQAKLRNPAELAELREQDALVAEEVWRKRETCGSGP